MIAGKRENKNAKPAVLPVHVVVVGNTANSNTFGLETWKTTLGFLMWKDGQNEAQRYSWQHVGSRFSVVPGQEQDIMKAVNIESFSCKVWQK